MKKSFFAKLFLFFASIIPIGSVSAKVIVKYGPPEPLYGMPDPEPAPIIKPLIFLSIILVPIILIIGIIVYLNKNRKNKK